MKTGKDQCPGSNSQAGDIPSYLKEGQPFRPIQLSTDWMVPALICYFIQSTDSEVNLIQNTLTDIPRITFDQMSWYLVAQLG